jgi:tRNA U34 5-methylaminomethyl-2-thiouridine-forming methyltransferase MnmC
MAPETGVEPGAFAPELVHTGDGSPTYLHPRHQASYRSLKGAATESRWVFLEGSGITRRAGPWRVLELGFGSGLNFHTTWEAANQADVELDYVALEPEPMSQSHWLVEEPWKALEWGAPLRRGRQSLTVHRKGWQNYCPPPGAYDVLYHDPFGPGVAPECWSAECFAWAARALCQTGILATYGASSAARRAMKQSGLFVGILPGAPGKREMTVAAPRPIAHSRPWGR